jgi:protein phosphatase
MVREARLQSILAESSSLQDAVDSLVEEANRNGGRDNITVVLFRVGGDEQKAVEAGDSSQDTATDLESQAVRAAAAKARSAPRGRLKRRAPRGRRRGPRRSRPRRPARVALISAISLVVVAALVVGAMAVLRNVYFIGQDDRGLVTLYRGLPYELPAGIKLYQSRYVSTVQARMLRPFERRRLLDHELRGHGDAATLIRNLEQSP